jgi:hypothetical protein
MKEVKAVKIQIETVGVKKKDFKLKEDKVVKKQVKNSADST